MSCFLCFLACSVKTDLSQALRLGRVSVDPSAWASFIFREAFWTKSFCGRNLRQAVYTKCWNPEIWKSNHVTWYCDTNKTPRKPTSTGCIPWRKLSLRSKTTYPSPGCSRWFWRKARIMPRCCFFSDSGKCHKMPRSLPLNEVFVFRSSKWPQLLVFWRSTLKGGTKVQPRFAKAVKPTSSELFWGYKREIAWCDLLPTKFTLLNASLSPVWLRKIRKKKSRQTPRF